jgi:hypothetical protein
MHPRLSLLLVLLAGISISSGAGAAAPVPGRPQPGSEGRGVEFFEKKIRPVLAEHCYACHSAEAAKNKKLRGGLRLDTREGMLQGGANGPAIVPGDTKKSLLLAAVRHEESAEKMPPKGMLPEAIISDLVCWIEMGAPAPSPRATASKGEIDWPAARRHWAYQPPAVHDTPRVKDPTWAKTAIDPFVLAELEKRGLRPVRFAGKREFLRRATFDLLGLPPTPEEIADFEQDNSPDAFARVVDRLLASPHHGERWGRYWLDVARYADDKALAFPTPWPHAYRYRDWVVRAFNRDLPYDRFLRLQLAGDLIPEVAANDPQELAGLGFQGLGAEYHKGSVAAQVMADELDDRIDTLTRGLLGLTAACARCHDHKYDPIPTRDYYSLAAAYNGASWSVLTLSPPDVVARYKSWEKEHQAMKARIARWTAQQKAGRLERDDRERLDAMQEELRRLERSAPPAPVQVHGVSGGGTALRIALRGNVERPGEPAPPGFLRILERDPPPSWARFTRLDLAEAVCSPGNPLTARVIVNRVWQHHFGRGIVGTASNFGSLGERPTHPELLDTLAVRFMQAGWSLKWLHRELMLSAAYRLSSQSDAHNAALAPDNAYLWRFTPRRLDVEAWRDAILAVSGRLDRVPGGPPGNLAEPGNVRRTLYGKVSRLEPDKMLVAFDFPDANVSSERRAVTVVPQQQLFVLNSEFMIASAKSLARRLEQADSRDERRIALAHHWALGRAPSAEEMRLALEFLRAPSAHPEDRLTAWEQYAQAILASNEFVWID